MKKHRILKIISVLVVISLAIFGWRYLITSHGGDTLTEEDKEIISSLGNISYDTWALRDGVYSLKCPVGERMCDGEIYTFTLYKYLLTDLNGDGKKDAVVVIKKKVQDQSGITLSEDPDEVIFPVIATSNGLSVLNRFGLTYDLHLVSADVIGKMVNLGKGSIKLQIEGKATTRSSAVLKDVVLKFDEIKKGFVVTSI